MVGLDSDRGEGLPDDSLADVGSNEQRDTGAESVALVKEFIKQKDNDASNSELDDDENGITGTELAQFTVHATPDIGNGLTQSDDESQN